MMALITSEWCLNQAMPDEEHVLPELLQAVPRYGRKCPVAIDMLECAPLCSVFRVRFNWIPGAFAEGMWWEFLMRMSLIDNVTVSYPVEANPPTALVKLHPVLLGQFREVPVPGVTDRLLLRWSYDGQPVAELDDQFEWERELAATTGVWQATLTCELCSVPNDEQIGAVAWRLNERLLLVADDTTEVRFDPQNLLTFTEDFNVGEIPPAGH